jgi:hypothetical protein
MALLGQKINEPRPLIFCFEELLYYLNLYKVNFYLPEVIFCVGFRPLQLPKILQHLCFGKSMVRS